MAPGNYSVMKKMLVLFSALMLSTAVLHAQTTDEIKSTPTKQKEEDADGTKTKVKPKTTAKDKAYNVVHRNKKRSHGTKAKTKTADGQKTRVETTTPTTTTKKDD
jgi:hypothetical protein